ncbi:hypothetical protein CkaCkLH20_07121 [Colletotrichum karsti]|uniref:Uncharacterized protein n=1 Tax=Colletotrichum karsti TaxID=1095194 RepID=A0A9P6I7A7_9PEZI|nr:uncharacterized protein CkaCkLH20_07121 [Colletotrichum karsti]KAF9875301.1 hypothetical protein CkaCkLH20_07121 [Colletotrichum karsti]
MATPQPKHNLPAEQAYNIAPQTYLRIPGLIFDPVPILIPYPHRAALNFLKPSRFKLDLSWEEYYDLLQPFDDVAYKLTDVFEHCLDELKYSVPDPAPIHAPTSASEDNAEEDEAEIETGTEMKTEMKTESHMKTETETNNKTEMKTETETETKPEADKTAENPHPPQKTDWKAFFERVLENLGHKAHEFGLGGEDVMWIAFLYTRAYDNTPKFIRARDRKYYRKANIHYLHDLLGDWQMLMRQKRLRWQVVFFDIFGKQ